MPTKIKVAYSEAQKAWTAQTEVSSDELSKDEIHALALEVAKAAGAESQLLTMSKLSRI